MGPAISLLGPCLIERFVDSTLQVKKHYCRSGNIRGKKFLAVKFSRYFIFIDRPHGALFIKQRKYFTCLIDGNKTMTKNSRSTILQESVCLVAGNLSFIERFIVLCSEYGESINRGYAAIIPRHLGLQWARPEGTLVRRRRAVRERSRWGLARGRGPGSQTGCCHQ